jgi:hypothetical protein
VTPVKVCVARSSLDIQRSTHGDEEFVFLGLLLSRRRHALTWNNHFQV